MSSFFTKNLVRRVITLMLIVALVPLIVVTVVSIYYSKDALEKDAFSKLQAIEEIKKGQVTNYFIERVADLDTLSKVPLVTKSLDDLEALYESNKTTTNLDTAAFINSPEYEALYKRIDPYLRNYMEKYGYYDIFLIDEVGDILYTVEKESDLGTSLRTGKYNNSNLGKLYANIIKTKMPCMVDFEPYAGSNNEAAAFIGTIIYDLNGKDHGVLAFQLSIKQIDEMMQENTGLGESGETYLVGSDFLMRSDSRFLKSGETSILKQKIQTEAAEEALRGKADQKIITDYRGHSVLSSYDLIQFSKLKNINADFDWAIIAEIDESEAFQPIYELATSLIIVGIILAVIVCVIGYFSARSIAFPIRDITSFANKIAEKDLTVQIEVKENREDEIGVLGKAFKIMLNSLREQAMEMSAGATQLATSINEISATTTQLSASTTETSTSLTEITTTVEEVRQTSQSSHEKAAEVAEKAESISNTVDEGIKATENTIEGINKINEEMEYIAQSTIKLGEQTQNIGEIITTVNGLADQSNLLSVNASIEAAKAGEYGKGFAVVAREVKNLADLSKEATKQISTILTDIQKAASAAVLATERGSNAVKEGLELSSVGGKAITELSANIKDSAEASIQIAAASQQQVSGMDQLAATMENIKEALEQNVNGTNQLETAAQSIDSLGLKLQSMASEFKTDGEHDIHKEIHKEEKKEEEK